MQEKATRPTASSRVTWGNLETPTWMQDLQEEVTELLGLRKSERLKVVNAAAGRR